MCCRTGFVVFYDFVGGLERSYPSVRLLSSLYRGTTLFGQPAVLRSSATVSDHALGYVAIIGAKQPILPYLFIYLFFIKYMTVCLTDSHTVRTTKTVTAALNTNTRHKTVYT